MSVCVTAHDYTDCMPVLMIMNDGPASQLGVDLSTSSHQHLHATHAILCVGEDDTAMDLRARP